MGIRKKVMEEGSKMAVKEEGIMVEYVRQGRERWRIVGVYVNENKTENGALDGG